MVVGAMVVSTAAGSVVVGDDVSVADVAIEGATVGWIWRADVPHPVATNTVATHTSANLRLTTRRYGIDDQLRQSQSPRPCVEQL